MQFPELRVMSHSFRCLPAHKTCTEEIGFNHKLHPKVFTTLFQTFETIYSTFTINILISVLSKK